MASLHIVARAAGLKDKEARQLFLALFDTCREGHKVYIHGFGTFYVVTQAARTVYSPQIPNGKADVPERLAFRFRQSTKLRAILNAGGKKKPKAKGSK